MKMLKCHSKQLVSRETNRRNTTTLLLCVLYMTHVRASQFSMDFIVTVTLGVLERYHSTCVFLLHSVTQQDELKQNVWILNVTYPIMKHYKFMSASSTKTFINKVENHKCIHILPSSDDYTRSFLIQVASSNSLSKRKWLLFMNTEESVEKFFSDIHVPFDCSFLVSQSSMSSENRNLYVSVSEVYHVHSSGPLQKILVANWYPGSGFSWVNLSFFQRRGDLQGLVIRAAYIVDPPFINGPLERNIPGFVNDLWHALQNRMNFTMEFILSNNGFLGYKDESGNWQGVVGALENKEADVGINLLAMTTQRMEAIDYLPPILNDKLMVHIKKEKIGISTLNHILAPFTSQLWCFSCLIIVVLVVILVTISCTNPRLTSSVDNQRFNILTSWFYVFGAVCQQGHDVTPRSWSCRLVYLTTYITALVLFLAYSAIFIAFLAVRRYDLPFTTYKGLLEDGSYRLGILDGSSIRSLFEETNDPTLIEVYKTLVKPYGDTFVNDDVQGLNNVCDLDRYAYTISLLSSFAVLSSQAKCKIIGIPSAYSSYTASSIISKDSPYKRLFNHHVQELRRIGVLDRIHKHALDEQLHRDMMEPFSGVTIEKIAIFYFIFSLGFIISILIFVAEWMWWKRRKGNIISTSV